MSVFASEVVAGAASGVAWWLLGGDRRFVRRRLVALAPGRDGVAVAHSNQPTSGVVRAAIAGVAVGVAASFIGGPIVAVLAGAPAAFVVQKRSSGGPRRLATHPPGDAAGALPAALDLLAACLSAGAPLEHALDSVAAAFGGITGDLLGGVARRAALGAPAEDAWRDALADPRWAAVGRAVVRAHHSGAALADVLSRLADDRRRAMRAAAEAAAQRAGVRAVLPLGLCFLPAFVLVGVVPVVAGFAKALWG